DTEKIGQFQPGESVYEAEDMAGNVWEWTSDWYLEDWYSMSPNVVPLGPENGELKVVRGGSYESTAEDLRAAARLGLDPADGYNNVGFRCVPIGEGGDTGLTPPFCKSSYVPFCSDPNDPGGDCGPGTTAQVTPTGQPDFEWLGFGCRDFGKITLTIDAGGPAADNYVTYVNGVPYTCIDSPEVPGRLICEGGSPPPSGSLAEIKVCPSDEAAGIGNPLLSLVLQQPSSPSLLSVAAPQTGGSQLVAYLSPQQIGLRAYAPSNSAAAAPQLQAFTMQSTTGGLCPEGYSYNENTGTCESDPGCPQGWTLNTETNQCEPGEDGCPEGTTFNADSQGCTPDDGECPTGYSLRAETNTCEPPQNDDGGGACPAGYFFDNNIRCCSPLTTSDCDPGNFRSAATNECVPTDENGCPPNFTYNPYEGACEPDLDENGDCRITGYVKNDAGECVPPQTGDNGTPSTDGEGNCRLEGYVMNDAGQCVPADTPTGNQGCGPNAYYDPSSEQCIELGEGECGPGYYYDENMQSCRPTDGPGSPCATGYAFSTRLNCCAPTPGNDGSSCPGEEPGEDSLRSVTAPSLTGYDYGQGYCEPGDGECPTGFTRNDQGACEPSEGDATPPDETGNCPEGMTYDPAYGACVGGATILRTVNNPCGEGQYFDYELGYCLQATCDGCALGFYYEPRLQSCLPYPDGDSCPDGYYYNSDAQTCLPIEQTTDGSCWTVVQTVPEACVYPTATPDNRCPRGESFNSNSGRCEEEPFERLVCEEVCTVDAYLCSLGPPYAVYETQCYVVE
ncbi:MAG: SUMF1/EgtB/PvdO family nonheme iron enzyme, partial [Anaerolineales bacterium]